MARIRTIKPEFFTSEDIVSLTPLARLFFIALWCEADREGRLSWKTRSLKMRYLPGDDADVVALSDELIDAGLIRIYEVDGESFADIPKFKTHQIINNREVDSFIPGHPDDEYSAAKRSSGAAAQRSKTQQELSNNAANDSIAQQNAAKTDSKNDHDACLTRESGVPGEGREGRKEGTVRIENAAVCSPVGERSSQRVSEQFERFWLAYPKKRNRGQAERAFAKLKPDDRLLETLLAAVQKARLRPDWRKDGGQYIPYASTWLHARGWEDEDVRPGAAASVIPEELALLFAGCGK